nr:NosR/NirI family protein [Rubrivivax pictus]
MSLVFRWLLLLACFTAPSASWSGAYEAELPDQIHSSKRLCDFAPCKDVFPGATSFGERKGQPPYVEAFAGDKLAGYVMLSTDITDIPAYSGKPVVTLIGMDLKGRFVGVKVLKHSEPILLLGIPESALIKFNEQYLGKFVGDKLEIGASRADEQAIGLDAISGATVTVIAQNQVMMTSGQAVAKQTGILAPTLRPQATFAERGDRPSWQQLVDEGSVQRLVVQAQQVGRDVSAGGRAPFIELWFGGLDHPDIGRALLGDAGWLNLRSRLAPHEHAIFVVRTAGSESFKGSGFVRGGLYDRVHVRQGSDTFTFRDLDYVNLYGLEAAGAPAVTESAIFIVRGQGFSAAYPWKLAFLGNRVDRATGTRSFARFDAETWLPAARLANGRPVIEEPEAAWQRVWSAKAPQIAAFAAMLIALGVVYSQRERLTRHSTRRNKWPVNAFKYSFWLAGIGLVGFGLMAQPSITQVLTWFHALLFHWEWQLFLSDPFIFLFWVFIIATVFIWGRGLFCGWICPFGSLSELLYKLGGAVGLKRFQFSVPRRWHDRLKWVKYGVFFGLVAVSMFSMPVAEMLAEVEPFKTTFLVGWGQRAWPYTLFMAVLLGLSIFVERPFCKYLCPLGASLAMPSTFRWFGLRRKQECSTCKACAVGCGAQAIDAHGRIDHRECLHCLDCMVLYTDTHACPPLAKERKRREAAGLPLTRINRDGYFIPIIPVQE